ncbi:MAG: adenosylcobalamin-dependent ribonucleoside-diphosphate reductase [Candidatus Omnitrophota bacterium]|nr:MAG: adenosylcobalamin-dependent ribonucleoside-diphosphate reductase [Candidatus Omnitrophota bacterium]
MAKVSFPRKVRKRDGSVAKFDRKKIERAIEKAAYQVLPEKSKANIIAKRITNIVVSRIEDIYKNKIPAIESIQDMVEAVLMSEGYNHIAKCFMLYRQERSQIRMAKSVLGVKDDLKLPINSMAVLKKRYLLKDEKQNIIETPSELFRRVASHLVKAEKNFKSPISSQEVEEKFYHMMRNLEFMPNSPTLMNAGTSLGQLAACFVLPIEDSMDGIFKALHHMAKIHQSGGGTGFSFSQLRPKGDIVSSTKGEASGPLSFMSVFDKATEVIVQGGRRRGANMGILRCDHPDIVEFIEAKSERAAFSNFNISVAVTDKFMEAVNKDRDFDLINPKTKKRTKTIKAKSLFDLIVNAAWRSGDPGLIFLDEINRKNPLPKLGRIEATNPCGELPLLPYESCNLASINLSKMVVEGSLDWGKLRETVFWGIRFLDDVIEVNKFPLRQIKDITLANRKIGLGVMGFADMLIKLGIPYTSKDAIRFAQKLMRFIHRESLHASMLLAKERGPFPNFKKSIYAKKNIKLRNATVNTIAPTGTISIIAGCSSGIEPLFAISFVRNVLSGTKLFEIHPIFEEIVKKKGLDTKDILTAIAQKGSLQQIPKIPPGLKRLFVTAFDVECQQHLQIQAAFQGHTDNSVSKTINLSPEATVEDVRKIYSLAHSLRCKGITIYRYGSKKEQVLSFDYKRESQQPPLNLITVDSEYSGGCVFGECPF